MSLVPENSLRKMTDDERAVCAKGATFLKKFSKIKTEPPLLLVTEVLTLSEALRAINQRLRGP